MIGFLLMSIGATISAIYTDFGMFMEEHHFKASALLVTIGVVIFLVAFFGCVGAVRESTMLINIVST